MPIAQNLATVLMSVPASRAWLTKVLRSRSRIRERLEDAVLVALDPARIRGRPAVPVRDLELHRDRPAERAGHRSAPGRERELLVGQYASRIKRNENGIFTALPDP